MELNEEEVKIIKSDISKIEEAFNTLDDKVISKVMEEFNRRDAERGLWQKIKNFFNNIFE